MSLGFYTVESLRKRKEKEKKIMIDRYYNLLVNKKPKFIKTNSSYERFFLYEALDKYSKNNNEIWSQRKKEYIKSSSSFCKEHKCKLKTIDCNNGIDEFFYECKKCEYSIDPLNTDAFLSPEEHCYKVKRVIGLNIFYENPNIPKIKHFTKN